MKYCFDEKIDRSKNHSAKWAELGKKFGTDDLFPKIGRASCRERV